MRKRTSREHRERTNTEHRDGEPAENTEKENKRKTQASNKVPAAPCPQWYQTADKQDDKSEHDIRLHNPELPPFATRVLFRVKLDIKTCVRLDLSQMEFL